MIDGRFAGVIYTKVVLANQAIGNAKEVLQLHNPVPGAANPDPSAW